MIPSFKALVYKGSFVLFFTLLSTSIFSQITVTNTNDAGPNSLREALNTVVNGQTIDFNIPGPGPHTINLINTLQLNARQNVLVDAVTGGEEIIVSGANATAFQINGNCDGSVIRGLTIVNSTNNAFEFNSGGSIVTIDQCHIGVDRAGNPGLGNGNNGIQTNNTQNVRITNCVISNNFDMGIQLNSSSSTLITGNIIGLMPDGVTPNGNEKDGINVSGGSNNIIGGPSPLLRNIISDNGDGNSTNFIGKVGVKINGSNNNIVIGNFIGTDITSTLDRGNDRHGVEILGTSTGNLVGGSSRDSTNIISGNGDPVGSITFIGHGVILNGGGVSQNRVSGNYIGTDSTGGTAVPNEVDGVQILDGDNNLIGGPIRAFGNVLSGNNSGLFLQGNADNNTARNNFIGTDPTGTFAVPNISEAAVIIQGAFTGGSNGNLIADNVISGNDGNGIRIQNADNYTTSFLTDNNTIVRNHIGINAAGNAALANGLNGIIIQRGANGNTIGGSAANRNIISGNTLSGIRLDSLIDDAVVSHNYIGLNAAGNTAIANDEHGIFLYKTAAGLTIGNDNVVSGNALNGIRLFGAIQSEIVSNLVGVLPDGTTALPNGLSGIALGEGSQRNIIGNVSGGGNAIGYHSDDAVALTGASTNRNTIRGNEMFCNQDIGIDHNGAANNTYAVPLITAYTPTTVSGIANANDIIDVYYDDAIAGCTAPGPGNCQGFQYLGTATANGAGNWTLTGTFTITNDLAVTATDATNGNTSEFTCILTLPPNAGNDSTTTICADLASFDLNTLLSSDADAGQDWLEETSPGNFTSTTNTIQPSTRGAGTYNFIYVASNASFPTNDTAFFTVVINPLPTTVLAALPNLCEGDAAFTLTQGSLPGGVYSGIGVLGSTFDPSVSGTGTFTITYTRDSAGCTNDATSDITVNPLPNVSLSPFSDLCEGDAAITLTGGTPAGGTYSGLGVSGGTFDPSVTGDGTFTITYTIDSAGCTNSTSRPINVIPRPLASLPAFSDICTDDTPFTLTGGNPLGGTYSGTGVVSGTTFDPSVSGAGTFTITYTRDSAGCTNSATNTITVIPLPQVNLAPFSTLCDAGAPITLTGGTPSGGTYSGPLISGTTIDPSLAGPGTYPITYTIDSAGCSNSDTENITINPLPVVALGPFAAVCEDDAPFILTGGTLPGGTYSGTGVSGTTFDPSVSGDGTFPITYTRDSAGCTNSAVSSITVNASPTVDLAPFADLCEGDAAITLTGGTLAGGTYSGPGVSATTFDPTVTGPGTFTITYTRDSLGCSNAATNTITVNPLPSVSLSPFSDLCEGDAVITLTGGSLPGGTYSGVGVTGTVFDPSVSGAGTFVITYSRDSLGCTNTATSTITVNPLPSVSLDPFSDICEGDGPLTLSQGSPSGGTYSGTGVSGGTFDPSVSGTGPFVITYTRDSAGCSNSATNTITVNPLPDASFSLSSTYCTSETSIDLNPSTAGGTFSITPTSGVISGTTFDPSASGAGNFSITYTVTVSGCTNSSTLSTSVSANPDADFAIDTVQCVNDPATVFPFIASSTYSGVGVTQPGGTGTNYQFDPSVSGTGVYLITHILDGGAGCQDTVEKSVRVNDTASISLDLSSFDPTCINAGEFDISGTGTPTGGVFSGTGISGTDFNPAIAGVGVEDITYTYVDPTTGCSSVATDAITVNDTLSVTLSPLEFCINEPTATLNNGTPSGGTYSGAGINSGQFDPSAVGVGTTIVNYQITSAAGCSSITSSTITVNDLPTFNIEDNLNTNFCLNGDQDTISIAPYGGIYSGSIGLVNDSIFDPAVAGTGSVTITYTFTDANGCTNDIDLNSQVDLLPDASFAIPDSVCLNDGVIVLNNTTNNTFSGPGVSISGTDYIFDPANATVGDDYEIIRILSAGTGCVDTATDTIDVKPLPNSAFSIPATQFCLNDADVTLTATEAGGSFSGPGVDPVTNVFSPSIAGIGSHDIKYRIQNEFDCLDSTIISVTVNDTPTVSFTIPTNICENESPINLSGTPAGGTFTGTGVTAVPTFDPSLAGVGGPYIISYEVNDATTTCSSVFDQNISVDAAPDATFGSLPSLICSGDPVINLVANSSGLTSSTFSGTGVSPGPPATFDPSGLTPGPYTITHTAQNANCQAVSTQTVTVDDSPEAGSANIGPFQLCDTEGDSIDLSTTISGNDAGGTWTDGFGNTYSNGFYNPEIDPQTVDDTTVVLTYTVSSAACGTDDVSVSIRIFEEPIVGFLPGSSFCEIDSTISLFPQNLNIDRSGIWRDLDNVGIITGDSVDLGNLTPGSYSFRYVLSSNGACNADSSQLTVSINAQPFAGVGDSVNICVEDSPFLLFNELSGTGINVPGEWYDASNASFIGLDTLATYNPSLLESGNYYYIVSNSCGADTATVNVQELQAFVNAGQDTVIEIGNTYQLQAIGNHHPNGIYAWLDSMNYLSDTSVSNPIVDAEKTTTYTVLYVDTFGCTASDTVQIIILEDFNDVIPTIITPDGDGVNDVWQLDILRNYPDARVEVRNRWGNILYESSNAFERPWDGTNNGNELPVGSYFFVIEFNADGLDPITGTISIIR